MHFKKAHDWVKVILWICVALTLIFLGCAIWNQYVELSIVLLVALFAFLLFLDYLEYCHIIRIRKRFVIAQELFTTAMLVYFSYAYFARKRQAVGDKALNNTRKKFDEVYDNSRYHLTMPLFGAAVKVFSKIKTIKNNIMSDLKNFSSSDGFNLDNAEDLTKQIGKLAERLDELSGIVSKGFKSKKSINEIVEDDKTDEADEETPKTRASANRTATRSKTTEKRRTTNKK